MEKGKAKEKMKKTTFTAILLLSLLLTACGGQTSDISSPAAESLPAVTELALGTFKLEGTEQAVTAEQAAELLPLWQVYQSLTASDTAAQAEIDALVQQIQGTMTSDQIQAIATLNLTQQDMMTVMAEENIVESASMPAARSTTTNAGDQGGGMPPSDMGGGDPSMMGGVQPVSGSSSSVDTSTASAYAGVSTGIPSALVSALIQMLESRAG